MMAGPRKAKAGSRGDPGALGQRATKLEQAKAELKRIEGKLQETEESLRSIVNAVTESALLIERDGTIVVVNEALGKRLGKSVDEMVGRCIYDFLPGDAGKSRRLAGEEVIRTGRPKQFDAVRSGRLIHNSVYPVFDSSGKVARLAIFGLDIEDRRKAEEELRQSEARYRSLCGNIPAMIYRARPDWSTIVISGSEPLTGYCPEEFNCGRINWREIIHPEDREGVLEAASKLEKRRRSLVQEYRIIGKDGSVHWVEDRKRAVFKGRVFQGVDGVVFDVTDRKSAERALQESELRYRTLFESLPVGVGVATKKGGVLDANSAMLAITGCSGAEIRQVNLNEVYVNKGERRRLLKELQTRGLVRGFEAQLKRADGTTYWASLNITPMSWAGRDVLLTVAADVTRQKEAVDKMRELACAVEQSIDGIAIGDLRPRLLRVNDAFARMHGYTAEEMTGMPASKLHNEQQKDRYKKALHELTTTGSWHGEIGHIKKDGTAFSSYMSISLLKDEKGNATGTLAIARDITESKRREEELRVFREKMIRAEQLASMGTLSATLAHELSQPLTAVRLSIDNALAKLERESSCEGVRRMLRDGLTGLSSITSLVKRFRNLARQSSEKVVGKVDLKAVAERTVILLNDSAREARVRLVLKDLEKLPIINSYSRDLEQLFFALVQNAIQAADGKRRHRLTISGSVLGKGSAVRLRFSDNCGGIAPEDVEKIFDPFFTTKEPGVGTGLGLCIVQNVASRVGGKVTVRNNWGKGTTFVVTLPAKTGSRSEVVADEKQISATRFSC
ncbi:MAG: PAS domain S-box protein [Phycisphaerales bacterium]|nr:MAG: PAS domain S-box protein [Phycisphaerales bacterium]